MRNRSKLLLAALTAALALTLGAATANASRSFSATNNTLLSYTSPALTFQGVGGQELICAVTLTASIHSVIAKLRGALAGFVNGGRASNCRNNLGFGTTSAIPLVSHIRPWHLRYESFRGILPRIEEVLFIITNAEFLIQVEIPFVGLLRCLYRGNVGVNTSGRVGYTIERLIPQPGANNVPLWEDGLNDPSQECEPEGILVGLFTATLPPVLRLL
jgi:hypothetical protein